MIFSVSIEVYDAISTGGTITNKNEYDIKTFFRSISSQAYVEEEHLHLVADPVVAYMSKPEIEKMIQKTKAAMQKAAKELDFIEAARLRDEMFQLEKKRDEMK